MKAVASKLVLLIDGRQYEVIVESPGRAVWLRKEGAKRSYRVRVWWPYCDCPARKFGRSCKHVPALQQVGLLVVDDAANDQRQRPGQGLADRGGGGHVPDH